MKLNSGFLRTFVLVTGLCFFGALAQADDNDDRAREEAKREQAKMERKDDINPYKKSFGVQAGLAIGNAQVEPITVSSNRTGFTLGGYVEVPMLPGFLYVQPELNYLQKGAENAHFGSLAAAKLSYVEMPLLAKVKLMVPSVKPFFLAGPTFAYLISGSVDGAGASFDRSRFNNVDIGFLLGAGVSFQLGDNLNSSEMTVSLRYTKGLNNLDAGTNQWKSNVLGMLVGIQI